MGVIDVIFCSKMTLSLVGVLATPVIPTKASFLISLETLKMALELSFLNQISSNFTYIHHFHIIFYNLTVFWILNWIYKEIFKRANDKVPPFLFWWFSFWCKPWSFWFRICKKICGFLKNLWSKKNKNNLRNLMFQKKISIFFKIKHLCCLYY